MSDIIREAHMRSQNKPRLTNNHPPATPVATPTDFGGTGPRALVIGLKILEHLATCQMPETPSALAAALDMAGASVYRALQVLQQRDYVARTPDGTYRRTSKLCDAQSTGLPHRRLLGHARQIMHSLSDTILQSCNLAIPVYPELQVVLHQESSGPFGINVPVGYRYDIPASAPGLAFAAFMKNSDPARWPAGHSAVVDAQAWTALKKTVHLATEAGFAQAANPHMPDVTDLSCPIYDNGHLVAVLTVPYIASRKNPNLTWCVATLQQAAEQLNEALQGDALAA